MEHKPRFYEDFGKPFTNKDVFVTFFRKKYNYLDIEKVYRELYSRVVFNIYSYFITYCISRY